MMEHIRESNLIEGVNSRKADQHSLEAWLWLIKQKKINHDVIFEIHNMAIKALIPQDYRGVYRRDSRQVGDRMCPHWEFVDALMLNVIYGLNNEEDPIKIHIRFEMCHPFVDGNGRIGRMLLWWHQKRLDKELILFRAEDKFEEYYPLFEGLTGAGISKA